jgi:large subunit ribosomal protein L7/L12
MGGFAAAAAVAPAAPVEEEEAAPAAQEKTLFNLKLQSFEPTSKPKIIKEIKSMLGLSLVDSKKFVESAEVDERGSAERGGRKDSGDAERSGRGSGDGIGLLRTL